VGRGVIQSTGEKRGGVGGTSITFAILLGPCQLEKCRCGERKGRESLAGKNGEAHRASRQRGGERNQGL